MKKSGSILIKNIYYMLTYAFQILRQDNYANIAAEEFEDSQNLFAAILTKGLSYQVKQGLYREYRSHTENLTVIRGRLDIQETMQNRMQRRPVVTCELDELSENNVFNQILKTSATVLLHEGSVEDIYKQQLKLLLRYFGNVDLISPSSIQWHRLRFHRNNKNYKMLLNLCYFLLNGMLQTREKGAYLMTPFSDEHMARLYERFILEYYRRHHPELNANSQQVKWNLDGEVDDSAIQFLPKMQTDIVLSGSRKTLIIDAKYYSHILQSNHSVETLRSQHLYQIFAYVKNYDVHASGNVSGMLLYAQTSEGPDIDCCYPMSGNSISVKTLDLNTAFDQIAKQLDSIADSLE